MSRSKLNPDQVNEDTLQDADGDTKVMVELNSDDDSVRIQTGGTERVIIDSSGRVGFGTSTPSELITIESTEPCVQFTEGGADRAKVFINDSDNLVIQQQQTNKHIVLKINDAGTVREGIRLNGMVPEVVVNEQSDSLVDFRVESDSNTHMLFVDGGNNNVGVNHSAPKSTLTVGGSMALRVTNIGASNDPGTTYTITDTECVILVNTRPTNQGGIDSAITLTLPDASDNPGMVVTVKDAAGFADVNTITIARAGSDTINGIDTSIALPAPASFKTFISDGNDAWQEIGN